MFAYYKSSEQHLSTSFIPLERATSISGFHPSRASNQMVPCAACKCLRKKCGPCFLSAFFPANKMDDYIAVAKVFGANKVTELLNGVPDEARSAAASSLVYEAMARCSDPKLGCYDIIMGLDKDKEESQNRIKELESLLQDLVPSPGDLRLHDITNSSRSSGRYPCLSADVPSPGQDLQLHAILCASSTGQDPRFSAAVPSRDLRLRDNPEFRTSSTGQDSCLSAAVPSLGQDPQLHAILCASAAVPSSASSTGQDPCLSAAVPSLGQDLQLSAILRAAVPSRPTGQDPRLSGAVPSPGRESLSADVPSDSRHTAPPVMVQSTAAPASSTPVMVQSTAAPASSTPVMVQSTAAPASSTPVMVQSTAAPASSTPVMVQSTAAPASSTPVMVQSTAAPASWGTKRKRS